MIYCNLIGNYLSEDSVFLINFRTLSKYETIHKESFPAEDEIQTELRFERELHLGQVMQKRVLCHMRTTKAQISLRIRAVWSAPLLFAA